MHRFDHNLDHRNVAIFALCAFACLEATLPCRRAEAEAPPAAVVLRPGTETLADADRPELHPWPVRDGAPRPAVIIFPGGGYQALMMSYEGHDLARWLNSIGVAGFVLRYRVKPHRHPAPLDDAHRAIRLVRARAAEWNVDPGKIGVMGFSAGGHLAAAAATIFDDGDPKAEDLVERQGCRPDFAIPVYPVVSFVAPCSHAGSRANLLGPDFDPKLAEELSPERRVTARTPPIFLVHGNDDVVVDVENTLLLAEACLRAKVPVEAHVFEKGTHGFGLGMEQGMPPGAPVREWPKLCEGWMRMRGILDGSAENGKRKMEKDPSGGDANTLPSIPSVELLPAPGDSGKAEGNRPRLWIHRPESLPAKAPAVVVCPGGGYARLVMDRAGHEVARRLNAAGAAAFVLEYRVKPNRHPAPLDDAQRAVRMIRARAAEWGIDPERIGIAGFSAGGHLAATAGTLWDRGKADAADPVERASCRPDFQALIFPVITFVEPSAHAGSMKNLIGPDADAALREALSPERHVTAEAPPAFLLHAADDDVVSPENSFLMVRALRKAGVPVEFHLYERGGHGFGFAEDDPYLSTWAERWVDWMKGRGILGK